MNVKRNDKVLYYHRRDDGIVEDMKTRVQYNSCGIIKTVDGKMYDLDGKSIKDKNEWIEEIKG